MAKAALTADIRALRVTHEEGLPDAGFKIRSGDIALNLRSGRTLLDVTDVNPFSAVRSMASRFAGSQAVAAKTAYDK